MSRLWTVLKTATRGLGPRIIPQSSFQVFLRKIGRRPVPGVNRGAPDTEAEATPQVKGVRKEMLK